jgi:hypothetical protein
MRRRLTRIGAALVLQLLALVLAHDVVYLARYGSRYGEALAHAGHGEAWSATVESTFLLALGLGVAGAARLFQLGLLVRRAGDARTTRTAPPMPLETATLLRIWLVTAPRIALVSAVLLTIQENVERAALTGAVTGPGILLAPEYAGGLWITLAIGLAVGLVAALFEWRRRVLVERLRTARTARSRPVRAASPRPLGPNSKPIGSILGRRSGLRAPPLPVPA